MNFELAQSLADNGKLVRRSSWPEGVVLFRQGGYDISLDKWSDRTALTKAALAQLGVTESFKILPHYDLFANGRLQCGYEFERDDAIANDWEEYVVEEKVASNDLANTPLAEPASLESGATTPQGVAEQTKDEPNRSSSEQNLEQTSELTQAVGKVEENVTAGPTANSDGSPLNEPTDKGATMGTQDQ